jgi:hypothetical protein
MFMITFSMAKVHHQMFMIAINLHLGWQISQMISLTEFDAHTRLKTIAAMGNTDEGLALLDKLDGFQS